MAYVSRPRGFELRDASKDVSVNMYLVKADDTAPIGIGDPVALDTDGVELVNGFYMPVVHRAAAGEAIVGVMVGCDPYIGRTESTINLSLKHRPASTKAVILVCDDINAVYAVQMDADGTDFTGADAFLYFDQITAVDCDLVTGISKAELDQSTAHATDGQFRVIGIDRKINNVTIEDNVTVLVKISNT
jgi:hypothetical protein